MSLETHPIIAPDHQQQRVRKGPQWFSVGYLNGGPDFNGVTGCVDYDLKNNGELIMLVKRGTRSTQLNKHTSGGGGQNGICSKHS